MKAVLIGFALLVMVGIGVLVWKARGFASAVAGVEAALTSGRPDAIRDDLPPLVEAFARRNMLGARPGSAIRLTQTAEMRLKRGAKWSPMTARQTFSVLRPGFVWDAEMQAGPIRMVRVVDGYHDGAGWLEVRALGAVRIARSDGPDVGVAEAMRYIAELVWLPDAILTNREIVWEETEEGVTARMDTPGGPAEVLFEFDEAGDIVAARAKDRPATLDDGTPTRLDWRGWLRDYAEMGGRRIPLQAEVGYEHPDGYESYWRGRVTGYEVVSGQ